MLLDEFPQLSFSYDLINSNLSTLRSKAVICILIQQNLSQLDYRYRHEGTRSILGNCNYQLILGSNDISSSKVFSDMIGSKKILKVSNSFSSATQQVRACKKQKQRSFLRNPSVISLFIPFVGWNPILTIWDINSFLAYRENHKSKIRFFHVISVIILTILILSNLYFWILAIFQYFGYFV